MKLRFLQPTESAAPGFPFRVGQVIEVSTLTAEMRAWLKPDATGTIRAALVREANEDAEVATVTPVERATVRAKRA